MDALVVIASVLLTLAALGWAIRVAVQAEKRAEAAEDREHDRELAAERAQASRVTVYKGRSVQFVGPFNFPNLKVNNASDQPIFAVTVHASTPDGSGMKTYRSKTRPSLPPGAVGEFDFSVSIDEASNHAPEAVGWAAVVFSDANEVTWLRTETGRLKPLPNDSGEAERVLTESLSEQWTTEARAEYAELVAESEG